MKHKQNKRGEEAQEAISPVTEININPAGETEIPTVSSPSSETAIGSSMVSGYWGSHAIIARSGFVHKSLSDFSFNTAVGCGHKCLVCYVPSTSTNKQIAPLTELGVIDPDGQWGDYVFVRKWDEKKFLASLAKANKATDLSLDGHRAVMFCTTTDPYQIIRNTDPKKADELTKAHRALVRKALSLILKNSNLNVRVLTRSPLARTDFDLMKSFGPRLLFGMSLPTLNNDVAKLYEPHAPAPSQRLETLKKAKAAGLHIFVAIAPTYPECTEADLRRTLTAVKELDPYTIFHEPINIRAENVQRIAENGKKLGVEFDTSVFEDGVKWRTYAIKQLMMVENIAKELGMHGKLHLWPDSTLASESKFLEVRRHAFAEEHPDATPYQIKQAKEEDRRMYENAYKPWIDHWHNRISEWPKKEGASHE